MENKKIDFNNPESLLKALSENIKKIDESKEKIKMLSEDRKSYESTILALVPFVKNGLLKNKKMTFLIIILAECLLYGIISQSYSLIKFIINLDIFKFLN